MRSVNCLTPRDLPMIPNMVLGDTLQFIKREMTFNQVKSSIRILKEKEPDRAYAIRQDEDTVNVWRWK